jgi:hypothetical protein
MVLLVGLFLVIPSITSAQSVPTFAVIDSTSILDVDKAAVATASLTEFLGLPEAPGGIISYSAEATYDGALINILDVRGGDVPFDSVPTQTVDNPGGVTTFSSTQLEAEPQAPIVMANVAVDVIGCRTDAATVTYSFTDVRSGDHSGVPIPGESVDKTYRRGDAKADGTVNIADALFVAQYLALLRDIGQDVTTVHAINAASAKGDAGGNKVNIADALFVAQVLALLRDDCYTLN